MKQEPEEELHLAGMLIDATDGKVDWTAYVDQAAQKTLIEAKLAGQKAEAMAQPRTILSLLDALKESVQAGNGMADGPGNVRRRPRRPAPRAQRRLIATASAAIRSPD